MRLRFFSHLVVLALFVAGGLLATFVSPAQAGLGRPATASAMAADMPCCPSDQAGAQDCTTDCPALIFCLAKSFAGGIARCTALPGPVMAPVARLGDDAERTSRTSAPPPRPPRS